MSCTKRYKKTRAVELAQLLANDTGNTFVAYQIIGSECWDFCQESSFKSTNKSETNVIVKPNPVKVTEPKNTKKSVK